MGTIGVKWPDRRKDSRFALGDMRNLSTNRPGFGWIGGKFPLLILRPQADTMSAHKSFDEALKTSLLLACQPSYIPLIEQGRAEVLLLPRTSVLEQLELMAATSLNLDDYWEYRRLLELAQLLDSAMVQRIVKWGLNSADPDIREAATDFQD
jgi:hypothetical protein